MAKASKKQLKTVQLLIQELERNLASKTKPVMKQAGDPPIEGEIRSGTYSNLYEVPVTDEDRATWKHRLEMMKQEEQRLKTELGVK